MTRKPSLCLIACAAALTVAGERPASAQFRTRAAAPVAVRALPIQALLPSAPRSGALGPDFLTPPSLLSRPTLPDPRAVAVPNAAAAPTVFLGAAAVLPTPVAVDAAVPGPSGASAESASATDSEPAAARPVRVKVSAAPQAVLPALKGLGNLGHESGAFSRASDVVFDGARRRADLAEPAPTRAGPRAAQSMFGLQGGRALNGVQKPAPADPLGKSPESVAVWGTVEVDGSGTDISAQAKERLLVRRWSTGALWWKKNFVTYVLRVAPGDVDRFASRNFSPVKELRVELRWSRVSDINGWGTDVNGRVTRAQMLNVAFPADDLEAGFRLVEEFSRDPLAVLARYPEAEQAIRQGWTDPAERGYVVDSSVRVVTGNRSADGEKLLFARSSRSGYYR